MSFIWPFMLLALLLIPLVVVLYSRLQRRRRMAAASLGPLGQVQSRTGGALGKRRHVPALFFLLGLIFLPWTTILYVLVAPGGVNGLFEWGFLILAFIIDIGAYTGGGLGNRDRLYGLRSNP